MVTASSALAAMVGEDQVYDDWLAALSQTSPRPQTR